MSGSETSGIPFSGRALLRLLDIVAYAILILLLANAVVVAPKMVEFLEGVPIVQTAADYAEMAVGGVNSFIEQKLVAAKLPTRWKRLPLPPVVYFVILFIVRSLVFYLQERIERYHLKKSALTTEVSPADANAAARRIAVQTYADAQAVLESTRMNLTFLSLDIVGSTKMKVGEDSVLIEQAFADYMKMVDAIMKRNGAYKTTWTPDGQMAAFKDARSGVRCGQEILIELERFNRDVSRIKTPFKLRAGANSGVVSTDDNQPMEKISDFSIDVAGHMQKHAEHDSLWISEKTFNELGDDMGFEKTAEVVDNNVVYAWRPTRSS